MYSAANLRGTTATMSLGSAIAARSSITAPPTGCAVQTATPLGPWCAITCPVPLRLSRVTVLSSSTSPAAASTATRPNRPQSLPSPAMPKAPAPRTPKKASLPAPSVPVPHTQTRNPCSATSPRLRNLSPPIPSRSRHSPRNGPSSVRAHAGLHSMSVMVTASFRGLGLETRL